MASRIITEIHPRIAICDMDFIFNDCRRSYHHITATKLAEHHRNANMTGAECRMVYIWSSGAGVIHHSYINLDH